MRGKLHVVLWAPWQKKNKREKGACLHVANIVAIDEQRKIIKTAKWPLEMWEIAVRKFTLVFGKPGVRGFDLFFLPPFFSFRFGKATTKVKTTSCAGGVGRAGFCCLACYTGKPHTEGRKRKKRKRKGTICQSLLLSFPRIESESLFFT